YDSQRIHRARVSYDDVAAVTADLLRRTVAQRLELPVMHPGRADVIGAGALVLRIVLERTGASSLIVSEHDILDGIAWSLAYLSVVDSDVGRRPRAGLSRGRRGTGAVGRQGHVEAFATSLCPPLAGHGTLRAHGRHCE